ncbi:MAG: heparinase II/III domain-containing protein [Candidatus Latescibacterota bacterium]
MHSSLRRLIPAFIAVLLSGAVDSSAEVWSTRIPHPVFPPDTAVTEDAVAKYLAMSENDLKTLVTTEGGKGINVTMKKAAYDFACLYQKTKKDVYADRAALLLERFAEVVPGWPMISRSNGSAIPWENVNLGDWSNSGLWGIWHHQDLERGRELPLAYDCIASSGALERRNAKTGRDTRYIIETDLLRFMVEQNLKMSYLRSELGPMPDGRAPFEFSNMAGPRFNGLIIYGKVFEPEYIHLVADWMRAFPTVMYFRDGVWHEGSPSYHLQITNRLLTPLPRQLKGYSDPPDYVNPKTGQRIDNLDLEKELARPYARMRSAIDNLALPDGFYLTIHDTHSNQRVYGVNQDSVVSQCLFGAHNAIMARNKGADAARAFLHFGGTDGHEHFDCLNLALWALGGELLSEGEYSRFGNREWNTCTAGHNLVVVDGKSQRSRSDNSIAPGPDDAVDGLSYNPCIGGHGSARNWGNLRLWDAAHPHLQVAEAEGENAQDDLSRYRRTVVMAGTGKTDFYLLDIFRVKGGNIHDWMLHGRLNEDYGHRMSQTAADVSEKRFTFLNLTGKAVTDSLWWNEFICGSGARIRTTMLPAPGTEVSFGRAPAMRRQGEATFLDVRRTGGDNVFVAVHEPYRNAPRIRRITPLTPAGDADSFVALKIELVDGRTDYVAHTLDTPPYSERLIPGTDIRFKGRFVHVALRKGTPEWMYLLEGASLQAGKTSLAAKSGDFSHRGRITDIQRVEKGDARDGFVTSTSLPIGGSLAGKTVLLTLSDGRTEGYTIAGIERRGKESFIRVNEEPGMELRDGGKLAKLVYYPWHGVRGPVDFLISGSVYRGKDGKAEATGK